jgi:hypothetical protein
MGLESVTVKASFVSLILSLIRGMLIVAVKLLAGIIRIPV